jgi:hypothetical protein
VANYYVHIQSPTMVVPQTKVSFLQPSYPVLVHSVRGSYYVHIQSLIIVVPQMKVSFLTTLISSPKQAGNDIDVFLEPLMEDM